jgi:hypothetical protein
MRVPVAADAAGGAEEHCAVHAGMCGKTKLVVAQWHRRYVHVPIQQAINTSKSKPEVFGLSAAPAAIVEGFAVFAFVFALVLSGGIPS